MPETEIGINIGMNSTKNDDGSTTIEIEPIKTDDGTSEIVIEISDDGLAESSIQFVDKEGNSLETIIEAPEGVDIVIEDDGSITQTLENDDGSASEIVAKSTGEIEAKIYNK